METKRCNICGLVKSVEEFNLLARKGTKPWRSAYCKPCDTKRVADYRRANPERWKATAKRFKERHPLQSRLLDMEKQARYRWSKEGLPTEDFTYAEVLARDGWLCYLCGQEVLDCELSFDHVIPREQGGPHSRDNVKVTHIRCNDSKGGKQAANARWMGRSQATPRGCYRKGCQEHGEHQHT